MNFYRVSNGSHTSLLKCPDTIPTAGHVLRVLRPFMTLAGHRYFPSDKMVLIKRTQAAPHGNVSSLGNWEVRCPYTNSVWFNIEHLMAIGLLG